MNTVQAIPKWRLFQCGGIPTWLKFQNGVQIKYGGHYEMSTHSGECYHYMTAISGKWLQHQLIRLNDHTTRIRVLRHSRLSNPANQEALTLLYKENISHGVQKNDFNTNTDKTLPNDRNYFRYRETIIVRTNNLLLRESANGATSHGRLACPARHMPMSKTENPRIRLI